MIYRELQSNRELFHLLACWRVMLVASPEKNRHRKSDDCSEADPPGKFHYRQPTRLFVKLCPKKRGEIVRQSAQDRDHSESDYHGEDVAVIVAAGFGQHAGQEDAENRAV